MEAAREAIMSAEMKNKLIARVSRPKDLQTSELKRMYQLFSQYYEGHPFENFNTDLNEKDDVIVLRDAATSEIQGFSTILKVQIEKDGSVYHGIFSGDTVVANQYWGSPALGVMFLKYMWLQKIKNPFRPLYWFLISKGFKTYLLMANNFNEHYPRFEKETSDHHQKLMDQFYTKKFKHLYHSESNLIIPSGESCHLKEQIADINSELAGLARVKFFQEKNPRWKEGVELCCIAKMSLTMPIKYSIKKFIKGILK